jgi:hypothetical protein
LFCQRALTTAGPSIDRYDYFLCHARRKNNIIAETLKEFGEQNYSGYELRAKFERSNFARSS